MNFRERLMYIYTSSVSIQIKTFIPRFEMRVNRT